MPAKLWSLTATEVQSLIERDLLTVEDYANALLSRIKSRDGVVKAWQHLGVPSSQSTAKQTGLTLIQIQTLS